MPETRSITSARPRIAALALVAGAALGLLGVAGLTTAAPAAADVSARAAVTDSSDLRLGLSDAADALETGRTTLTSAAVTVVEAKSSDVDLGAAGAVETSGLVEAMDALADDDATALMRSTMTANTIVQTELVAAQTAAVRSQLDAAIEKKQAEEAAAAEAAAQAAALAAANTPDGARDVAAVIAADEYGWGGDQFSCLDSLWTKESGWDYQAYNQNGGATGIPQALPGSKMASFGSDWATNATTQIRWGLDYISNVYGTPCSAWGHSQSVNWY